MSETWRELSGKPCGDISALEVVNSIDEILNGWYGEPVDGHWYTPPTIEPTADDRTLMRETIEHFVASHALGYKLMKRIEVLKRPIKQ